MAAPDALKVLYLAGMSHSGSTIIGHALGEVDGFFFAGEIDNLWQRGLIENRTCGCGEPFRECETWSAILRAAYPFLTLAEIERMRDIHLKYVRLRGARTLVDLRNGRLPASHPLLHYRNMLDRLYTAIRKTTGAGVIVDSSKSPWYAAVLGTSPRIDLHLVHIVRDPRGNIFSFVRRGRHSSRELLFRAARWNAWHLATERLHARGGAPYVRVRYEDFVSRPSETMIEILGLVGIDDPALEFLSEGSVRLHPKHLFSANRSRNVVGDVALKLDQEWRSQLPAGPRTMITAITLPIARRYGYGPS